MFRRVVLIVPMSALLVSVPAHACMLPFVIFAFGSLELSIEGRREVLSVLEEARTHPTAKVKLTATTDGFTRNLQMSPPRGRHQSSACQGRSA